MALAASTVPTPGPSPSPLSLLRTLARQGGRLRLSWSGQAPLPMLLLPETLDETGFALITLLPPSTPSPALPDTGTVHSEAQLEGLPLQFSTQVQDWQIEDRGWRLWLRLPSHITRNESRQSYRIPVPPTHPAAEAVLVGSSEVLPARITDLTRQGLGFALRQPGVALPAGESRLECELGRDPARLRLWLHLCHHRLQDGVVHGGGLIQPRYPTDQRRLDDWIAVLERQWLRQRQSRPGA